MRTIQGNRIMSDFIAASGLGIDGIGVPHIMTIRYKPGEIVDEKRVSDVMDKMIAASDEEKTSFKILSYDVLSVDFVTEEE